jgi:predicted metal-dependent hydrolase
MDRSNLAPDTRHLAEGVQLFNERKFWHAHEAWEKIWLESEGEQKRFLQGLIQLSAAYHHVRKGTFGGAMRLFDAALTKLAPFPDGYLGIDRAEAVARAREHFERLVSNKNIDAGEYPNIRYN